MERYTLTTKPAPQRSPEVGMPRIPRRLFRPLALLLAGGAFLAIGVTVLHIEPSPERPQMAVYMPPQTERAQEDRPPVEVPVSTRRQERRRAADPALDTHPVPRTTTASRPSASPRGAEETAERAAADPPEAHDPSASPRISPGDVERVTTVYPGPDGSPVSPRPPLDDAERIVLQAPGQEGRTPSRRSPIDEVGRVLGQGPQGSSTSRRPSSAQEGIAGGRGLAGRLGSVLSGDTSAVEAVFGDVSSGRLPTRPSDALEMVSTMGETAERVLRGGTRPSDRPEITRGASQLPDRHGAPSSRPLELARSRDVDTRAQWEAVANDTTGCDHPTSVLGQAQSTLLTATQQVRGHVTRYPAEREMEMGALIHRGLQRGGELRLLDAPRTQRYLEELLHAIDEQRSDRTIPLRVFLVDSPVSNAFASLGGYVYVFRGLLEEGDLVRDEASLVAVLAHEVAHHEYRHVALALDVLTSLGLDLNSPMLEIGVVAFGRALQRSYSRAFELEADVYAYRVLRDLGYSPLRVERLWTRLSHEESHGTPEANPAASAMRLLESHPTAIERACHLRALLREEPPQADRAYRGTANFPDRISAFRRLD